MTDMSGMIRKEKKSTAPCANVAAMRRARGAPSAAATGLVAGADSVRTIDIGGSRRGEQPHRGAHGKVVRGIPPAPGVADDVGGEGGGADGGCEDVVDLGAGRVALEVV